MSSGVLVIIIGVCIFGMFIVNSIDDALSTKEWHNDLAVGCLSLILLVGFIATVWLCVNLVGGI